MGRSRSRMRHRVGLAIWGAVFVALGGGASTAGATVMVEHTLEDMIRGAQVIVHGTVEHVGSQVLLRHGASLDPMTVTRIRVREWHKGGCLPASAATACARPDHVIVRELGGAFTAGDESHGMRIDGVPTYRPREEVVLFLEPDPRGGDAYRTFGMVQGKFLVRHGVPGAPSVVERDARSVGLARWTDGHMTITHGGAEAMRLEEFVAVIHGVLRETTPPAGSPPTSTVAPGGGR